MDPKIVRLDHNELEWIMMSQNGSEYLLGHNALKSIPFGS